MEFNGDVYACDHFVFPEYKLGNIYQKTLVEMMYGLSLIHIQMCIRDRTYPARYFKLEPVTEINNKAVTAVGEIGVLLK